MKLVTEFEFGFVSKYLHRDQRTGADRPAQLFIGGRRCVAEDTFERCGDFKYGRCRPSILRFYDTVEQGRQTKFNPNEFRLSGQIFEGQDRQSFPDVF